MEPFEQKVDIEVNDIQKAIKKNISRPSKPVKFTWEGLKNFGLLFETNPFDKLKTSRLQQLMSGKDKGEEKDYVDFFYLDVISSGREIDIAINIIRKLNKPVLVGLHIKKNGKRNNLFR